MMKTFHQIRYRCLLCVTLALTHVGVLRADDRPNLVLIIADDLGFGETGMQGNSQIPTPGIDALAASGVRCSKGYVTASYCSPSRAGLLTGRYQSRFGYDVNPTGELNFLEAAGPPVSETTFISKLQSAGYQTALMGKWHLGSVPSKRPQQRGFDEFYGFLHEGHYYVEGPPYPSVRTMLRTQSLAPGVFVTEGNGIVRGNYTGRDEPAYDDRNPILAGNEVVGETDYLTDAITREAIRYIDSVNKQKPFALVVAYNAVHSPMQGLSSDFETAAGIEPLQRRIFASMLIALDRGVASIRESLQTSGHLEDTLFVFVSDNGGPTLELTSSNAPLRGGKGDLYEGGIRVPMVWSMPSTLPPNRVETRAISSLDIAATTLALAGLPIDESLDGVNVIDHLRGVRKEPIHKQLYWRFGKDKSALMLGDWKIVRHRADSPFELYHLASDVSESNDLATQKPDRFAELKSQWRSINNEMMPPIRLRSAQ